jgi:hypothetical protein
MVTVVENMLITLGGFGGSGYTFLDLIRDVVGVGSPLASLGVFGAIAASAAYMGGAMKSLFIKDIFFDALEAGSELAKDLKDEL